MKRACIISIGNEILAGRTVDTNAAYLSRKLLSCGIPAVSFFTISDDVEVISKTLAKAADEADVILVTGGLGPTDDDITRQGLAKFLGVELQLHEKMLKNIEEFFAKRNIQMSDKNKIQAFIPAGSAALVNSLGTAPGIMAEYENRIIVALPGVPSEMKQMFEDSVFSRLEKLSQDQVVLIRRLKCFGTGESNIAEMLGDLMRRGRNPLINCTVRYGVITLHIVAASKDKSDAEKMIEKDVQNLRDLLGDLIYGTDEQTLAEVVGKKLTQQNKTIAVAESCTGGLITKMLTDIPGASRYFTYGWITYSNQAKISELGVSADLIEKYGAVSEQVAEAMAKSARKKAGTDFTIATTGIAGPEGGSEQKPVGLVYIAVSSEKHCRTRRFVFSHTRETIRQRTAQAALNMLRMELES